MLCAARGWFGIPKEWSQSIGRGSASDPEFLHDHRHQGIVSRTPVSRFRKRSGQGLKDHLGFGLGFVLTSFPLGRICYGFNSPA